jgi:ABC-type phosphate transport system substrate-binding protein
MRLPKYIAACSLAALGFGATASMADVVVVVSAKSQVVALSKSQVADIFLGKSARFPDGSSAVRDEFYNSITGKSAAQIKAHWSKIIFTGRGQPPKAVSNSAAAKELVTADAHAISYIERSALDGSVKVLFPP